MTLDGFKKRLDKFMEVSLSIVTSYDGYMLPLGLEAVSL